MTVNVFRNGKWIEVAPNDLSVGELCDALSRIDIGEVDSYGNFRPKSECDSGYAVIEEAIKRLERSGR